MYEIEQLMIGAGMAGDERMVAICRRALAGSQRALAICRRVIRQAAAQA